MFIHNHFDALGLITKMIVWKLAIANGKWFVFNRFSHLQMSFCWTIQSTVVWLRMTGISYRWNDACAHVQFRDFVIQKLQVMLHSIRGHFVGKSQLAFDSLSRSHRIPFNRWPVFLCNANHFKGFLLNALQCNGAHQFTVISPKMELIEWTDVTKRLFKSNAFHCFYPPYDRQQLYNSMNLCTAIVSTHSEAIL